MTEHPANYKRFFSLKDVVPARLKAAVQAEGAEKALDFDKLLHHWERACSGEVDWIWGNSACVQAIAEALELCVITLSVKDDETLEYVLRTSSLSLTLFRAALCVVPVRSTATRSVMIVNSDATHFKAFAVLADVVGRNGLLL